MKNDLKNEFDQLFFRYTNDQNRINAGWKDLEQAYTEHGRFYHTLLHISDVINYISEVKNKIKNYDLVLFSAFYHDIVYDVMQQDNELQSALYAADVLRALGIDPADILTCKKQILATATHQSDGNTDTDYFLDADLAALGMPWHLYEQYATNIRKEYAAYSDEQYFAGRKNVLRKFLERNFIYKTKYFKNKLETQARINIEKEIAAYN